MSSFLLKKIQSKDKNYSAMGWAPFWISLTINGGRCVQGCCRWEHFQLIQIIYHHIYQHIPKILTLGLLEIEECFCAPLVYILADLPVAYSGYDTKMNPIMRLQFWSSRESGVMPLFPFLLMLNRPRVSAHFRVPSMGRINLFQIMKF